MVIHENHNWLGAACFVGAGEVMLGWVRVYRAAVESLMGEGLMGAEQQVIYAMYNTMAPKTQLQLYQGTRGGSVWFHLAYVAKDACVEELAGRSRANKTNGL